MIDYIIKTHNELPYLAMYLWSMKQDKKAWDQFNIIVYANNCTDGTQEWLTRQNINFESVDLPGLYAIWNYGASKTNNNRIIFSASDFVLAPDFWSTILKCYNDSYYHWTASCIDNGLSYPHDDVEQRRWYKRDCGDNWKDFDYIKFCTYVQELQNKTINSITPRETSYCPFITTRSHYNFLNGFNTQLGDYPTDIDHDFLRRGKEVYRECCIVNQAYFWHFGKKSLLRRDGEELSYTVDDIGAL